LSEVECYYKTFTSTFVFLGFLLLSQNVVCLKISVLEKPVLKFYTHCFIYKPQLFFFLVFITSTVQRAGIFR
jgi:hypothetical protein